MVLNRTKSEIVFDPARLYQEAVSTFPVPHEPRAAGLAPGLRRDRSFIDARDEFDPTDDPPRRVRRSDPPESIGASTWVIICLLTTACTSLFLLLSTTTTEPLFSHMPTFTLPPILSWNTSSKSADSPNLLARVQALEAALFRLSRDHVAQQDFAYRYAGAHVIEDLTTPTPHLTTAKDHINPAFAALDDDTRVGRCWRIPGKTGQLGIELIARVMISAITVDHVPKELVFDTNHAPRDIVLWGVIDEENYGSLKAINGSAVPFPPLPHATPLIGNISTNVVPLSKFRYNTSDPNSIQTFAVSEAVISSGVAFSRVIVDIVNNWGSTWTCLYRIRIHGDVATTPLEFNA